MDEKQQMNVEGSFEVSILKISKFNIEKSFKIYIEWMINYLNSWAAG